MTSEDFSALVMAAAWASIAFQWFYIIINPNHEKSNFWFVLAIIFLFIGLIT